MKGLNPKKTSSAFFKIYPDKKRKEDPKIHVKKLDGSERSVRSARWSQLEFFERQSWANMPKDLMFFL